MAAALWDEIQARYDFAADDPFDPTAFHSPGRWVLGARTDTQRAGDPQPEAMRFYAKSGFTPIPSFGRWMNDPTARCLARRIEP